MVQSGIAYAAGQLLAVVAPRTVLVVDAPTDWSLAGPLWELALDDAPVDEILDVLIRRGIRTAPSFAIVRVENDAVRALVRGSVPVCFERVGEPVRLDATGATTWLEGLISSARRVLVGPIETNSTLPYLVSTGVVLVSGLALPCGPADRETPAPSAPEASGEPDGGGASGEPSASYFSRPAPAPVASAAGREPRVVDLTRSGARNPAKALASARSGGDSNGRAARGSELNGHAPTVVDAAPAPVFEPAPTFEPSPYEATSFESASNVEAPPVVEAAPASRPVENYRTTTSKPPIYAPDPRPEPPAPAEPVAALQAEPAPAPERSRFEPIDFGSISADDPGELQDLDQPAPAAIAAEPAVATPPPVEAPAAPAPAPVSAEDYFAANGYSALGDRPAAPAVDEPEPVAAAVPAPASLDDLLAEPAAEEEAPRGPSPADLPNLDPPSLSLPMLNGHAPAVPAQPHGFGRAPANWPPAPEPTPDDAGRGPGASTFEGAPAEQSFPEDDRSVGEHVDEADSAGQAPARPNFTWVGPNTDRQNDAPAAPSAPEPPAADSAANSFLPPVLRQDGAEQPALGDLPLRIRGRSLRPEQRLGTAAAPGGVGGNAPSGNGGAGNGVANGGGRLLGGPDSDVPSPPPFQPNTDRFRDANGVAGLPSPATDAAGSGSLLLPAFFRGARAARKPDGSDAALDEAPVAHDGVDPASPSSWIPNGAGPAAPAAWVPPVRRGFPDRSSGFNGGPPAMPGVLRSNADDSPAADEQPYDDYAEELTEATPPPGADVVHEDGEHESHREPPRLLGVWCDAGHVTSPDSPECRVCGLPVPPQAPILVARPPLGVLIFDNGDRVTVDRPVVLGRDPKAVSSPDPETPVLHAVPSATGQVSRTHAEIRASGWDVVLTDLGAMNGTALTLPGENPIAIEPNTPTALAPGARVDLGGESGFVFEVDA